MMFPESGVPTRKIATPINVAHSICCHSRMKDTKIKIGAEKSVLKNG